MFYLLYHFFVFCALDDGPGTKYTSNKQLRVSSCCICMIYVIVKWYMSLAMEFAVSKIANACTVKAISCTLYPMSKQNFRHICSSVCCHSQNCTWLTWLHSNRFCIFIGDTDKSRHDKYSNCMFVQYQSPWILCILLCMGFTVLQSEHNLLKAVVAHCRHSVIHLLIRTISTNMLYVLLPFHYPRHTAVAALSFSL